MMRDRLKAALDRHPELDRCEGYILIVIERLNENYIGFKQISRLPNDEEEARAIVLAAADYCENSANHIIEDKLQ